MILFRCGGQIHNCLCVISSRQCVPKTKISTLHGALYRRQHIHDDYSLLQTGDRVDCRRYFRLCRWYGRLYRQYVQLCHRFVLGFDNKSATTWIFMSHVMILSLVTSSIQWQTRMWFWHPTVSGLHVMLTVM